MADKKSKELLGGAQPVDPNEPLDPFEEAERKEAERQHGVLVENIESHTCPYHGQSLKIQREKRIVDEYDHETGRATGKKKEITVRYAVCACTTPGQGNPYRGKRVWEQT